jgi:hypothetical protein
VRAGTRLPRDATARARAPQRRQQACAACRSRASRLVSRLLRCVHSSLPCAPCGSSSGRQLVRRRASLVHDAHVLCIGWKDTVPGGDWPTHQHVDERLTDASD